MPLVAPIQTSFNAGEFSPLTLGRVDYPKYKMGVVLMQNMLPQVQGGTTKRTGTYYVNPSKANGQARLVRFVFSNGDAFLLEYGDKYLRFYRNRAQVNVTGAATYNPATSYAIGQYVTYSGSQYISLTAANVGHQPDISPANWNKQDAYEIATPYAIADVPFLRFQQIKDVLYIAHPSYAPQKLIRSGLTSWAFTKVAFLDGPYLQINSGTTTLTSSAIAVGTTTITASSIVGINSDTGFQPGDVGRQIRLKHSTTWGYATITAVTDTTHVTATIVSAFGATTATGVWRVGEWSDFAGYPSVVFLYQDRLGWAASPAAPTTLNMSKTSDYENMAPTDASAVVAADNSLQLRINDKQQDPIRWVADTENGLLVGTKGAEYAMPSPSDGTATSAISYPALRKTTKYGSANVPVIEAGKAVLFAQTAKRKLREMAFVYDNNGYDAPDMTVLAEHITKGNIAEMIFQQEPYSVVWMRLENGQLRGMTYDRQQNVIGWHRHILGGFYDVAHTDSAHVESIETIPSPDGSQDDVWMIVARYINGGIKRYVEYLAPFNADYDDVKNCYFVDGGKTITLGASGTVVTGLDHLEGQVVGMLVDGSAQPSKTVTSGEIALDRAGILIQVGLPYVPRIKTLRPEAGSANGTSQGKTKRTHKLAGRFHQTVGVRVGRDFEENGVIVDDIDFAPGDRIMDQAVPLYSGDKQLDYEDDYNSDGYICFEQNQPYPFTLLAIMPQLNTQDGA